MILTPLVISVFASCDGWGNRMDGSQRGAASVSGIAVSVAVLILVPLMVVGFYEGRKAYWDEQVRQMCAKDGGVSILEKVFISKEQEKYLPHVDGVVTVSKESLSDPRAPAFSKAIETVVESGNPSVLRYEQVIVRRADKATTARAVIYVRTGGDLPSPAFPSSYYCPPLNKINSDISKIFKIEESNK